MRRSNSIEIERLINVNNIKYDDLVPIINEAFVGSTATELNLYIDTYSILKVLYSSIDVKLGEYNNIVSCLVNMISHYRAFFLTRYNVYTHVYIVHSTNTPYINNKFIKDYNKNYVGKFNAKSDISNYIKNNLDLLRLLIQYIPNAYLIESEFESGVLMYDLMSRTDAENKRGHIILTKDIYNFQLVNMKPQTIVIRSKRDDSYYINRNNLLDSYFKERRIQSKNTVIAPDMLSVIMSLHMLKERNINTLFNINRVLSILEHALQSGVILNGYNYNLDSLWNYIENVTQGKIKANVFDNRFKAIDILFQHGVFINTVECNNINTILVDKHDPEELKEINNKHFVSNPLDLNRL